MTQVYKQGNLNVLSSCLTIAVYTAGDVRELSDSVQVMFIIGRSADPTYHNLLLQESAHYHDTLYIGYNVSVSAC